MSLVVRRPPPATRQEGGGIRLHLVPPSPGERKIEEEKKERSLNIERKKKEDKGGQGEVEKRGSEKKGEKVEKGPREARKN